MKFKIQKEQKNSLLNRLDLEVLIDHEGGATPSKEDIRKKLSIEKGWDLAQIEVKFVHSIYGSPFSKGIIKIWDEAQEKLKPIEEKNSKENPIENASEEIPVEEKKDIKKETVEKKVEPKSVEKKEEKQLEKEQPKVEKKEEK